MEQMSIQATELKNSKNKCQVWKQIMSLHKFKTKKKKGKIKGWRKESRVLEKDLTLEKPLGDIKDILWTNIIDSINDIWPSIQIIFEQTD
jgi:hypothetical protein